MFLSLVVHIFLPFFPKALIVRVRGKRIFFKILTLSPIWQFIQMYWLNLLTFLVTWTLRGIFAEAETSFSQYLGNWMSPLITEAFSDCTSTTINNREPTILSSSPRSLIFLIAWLLFHSLTLFWTASVSCHCDKAQEWLNRVHFR